MIIRSPKNFDFRNTVYSHGWCDLRPFIFDQENWTFSYVFGGPDLKSPLSATVSSTGKSIRVETPGVELDALAKSKLRAKIEHMLRLDEEFDHFYALTEKASEFSWISDMNAGRLIRTPTVFEDLVKTICTTNCSWGLTRSMVANLVDKLGESASNGAKAFPTAAAMAEMDEEFFRIEIRAGYRSSYLVELSQSVASGAVDPESWLTSNLSTSDLKREIKRVKGVGEYAAESLLKLIGRYDGLALDSFLRSEFYKRHNKGKVCPDKKIEKFYGRFGEWRGLAIWFDMTKRFLV